jgi:hypothetical protein
MTIDTSKTHIFDRVLEVSKATPCTLTNKKIVGEFHYKSRQKLACHICHLRQTIPPPPGGTAILPEYIHYYGCYYQVIVQCLST